MLLFNKIIAIITTSTEELPVAAAVSLLCSEIGQACCVSRGQKCDCVAGSKLACKSCVAWKAVERQNLSKSAELPHLCSYRHPSSIITESHAGHQHLRNHPKSTCQMPMDGDILGVRTASEQDARWGRVTPPLQRAMPSCLQDFVLHVLSLSSFQ